MRSALSTLKSLDVVGLSWLTRLCNIAWRLGQCLWSGMANRGGGPSFKRGTRESVFQLQGDHTSQPPRKGLRQGTGEENLAGESTPTGLRRNNAVFVPVVEHWTSSIPSAGCLRVYGSFAQPVHMCFVDLEKAFDRVPRGILWGECSAVYGVRGPLLRAVRSLYDRSRSLDSHCRQCSQGPEGVRFGNHRISYLLFADDDVVLLASSGQDLQHVLERFAAECEAAGMRISTSKSEAMVLDRKRVACPLRVGGEVLPQWKEFKYLGVLFTSEGKMEREIDRRIGAASAVMRSVYQDRRGEEGAESKWALDLPVNLRSHPHL
ncbi:hypothetical protein L3Q82_023414 [Scortum barcoo]|uniref:Uncharacterized protein n=1 Tax=Scortum barcoo TaxID=214431 RepID=A0ACB8WYW0_9TELE|nr:hypothetical protein L3Q82_023414 [Scortum barcoo]